VGGTALVFAMDKIKAKARTIAAHELEVSADDLEWIDGAYRVRGAPDKAKTIPEIALSAWHAHGLPEGVEPHLNGTAVWDPPNFTWPSGTHVCVSEVDTETGKVRILRYVGVDDCGVVINPQIVEGQIQGGVTMGIAEALYEDAAYDPHGNLTTPNLTTYLVPSAADVPAFTLDRTETPSTTNPLGVKGIGEAGTIAAPPAVVNSVVDALSHLGVTDVAKPATPEAVWRAIDEARGGGR
jgi:carbon-monoxide dehydrogenase large subunit